MSLHNLGVEADAQLAGLLHDYDELQAERDRLLEFVTAIGYDPERIKTWYAVRKEKQNEV